MFRSDSNDKKKKRRNRNRDSSSGSGSEKKNGNEAKNYDKKIMEPNAGSEDEEQKDPAVKQQETLAKQIEEASEF